MCHNIVYGAKHILVGSYELQTVARPQTGANSLRLIRQLTEALEFSALALTRIYSVSHGKGAVFLGNNKT